MILLLIEDPVLGNEQQQSTAVGVPAPSFRLGLNYSQSYPSDCVSVILE